MEDYGYTLVQHSAYGYGGNPQFRRGLEECAIQTKVDYNRVVRAGGVLLPDYVTAADMADRAMYPPGYDTPPIPLARLTDSYTNSIIPAARGGFSKLQIDGLHIYVPPGGLIDAN